MSAIADLLAPRLVRPRIGTLMLPVAFARASDSLVRSAASFADQLGASLLGVACADPKTAQLTSAVEQEAVRRVTEAAGERFDELTQSVLAGGRWKRCDEPMERALEQEAWAADLLVVNHPSLAACALDTSALRRWMRGAACPVLVTGRAQASLRLGCAAVLCDGSPRSRRAVRAAMPILLRCRRVVLFGLATAGLALRKALRERGVEVVDLELDRAHGSHGVAERMLGSDADVLISGGWPEPLEGWPRRSITDALLQAGTQHLFLCG